MELLLLPLTSLPGAAGGGGEGLPAAEHWAPRRALLLLLQDEKAGGFRGIGDRERRGVERETVGGEGIGRTGTAIVLELKIFSRCPQRARPQTGATRWPLATKGAIPSLFLCVFHRHSICGGNRNSKAGSREGKALWLGLVPATTLPYQGTSFAYVLPGFLNAKLLCILPKEK